MRLVRVQVTGFGRIRNSSFSADRKLTAILGPNEAGKTTLLRALLSLNDEAAIPESGRNRSSAVKETDTLVEVEYVLSDADLLPFAEKGWLHLPKRMVVTKRANGSIVRTLSSEPSHREDVWKRATAALSDYRKKVGDELADSADIPPEANEERTVARATLDRLTSGLADREMTVTEAELAALVLAIDNQAEHSVWLEPKAFESVTQALLPLVVDPNPTASLKQHLESRRPRFEMFTEEDRKLEHEYTFADLEASEPRALRNLIALGDKTIADILPNPAKRTPVATAQDHVTDVLEHTFKQAWKQHPIAVKVSFEPDRLIILVRDKAPGGQTIAFDERSDGLRTFVALTAFLSTRPGDVPPILLIDEAEARLHWDAQADLIAVLQSSSEVGQILYTTHSPGCLPPDLGTGVIFVQPDKTDANLSIIRRDFWSVQSEDSFGAAPILFMMGASAAAFSRVRRAVVAEGPSDMMLLPTLFRAATKLEELDFQIVPGISVTSKDQLSALDETGVRVAYLVDGDAQGKEWKHQLEEDAKVASNRIKSLPKNLAAEDLLQRDFYVGVFLETAGRAESPTDLTLSPGVLKPQLEALCVNEWGIEPPGAVDVAEAILSKLDAEHPGVPDHQRLTLAAGAGPALRKLHDELMELLKPVAAAEESA